LRANLLPSTTPPARPTTVPTPARTVLAPLEPAFPFEDDAPPPLARGAREPFRLRARVPELLVLPEERLALAPEFLDFAFGPFDLAGAPLALPFEALAPFLAPEPPEVALEDRAGEDFR